MNATSGFLIATALAALLNSAAAWAAPLAAQSVERGGVSVSVKPLAVPEDGAPWQFRVALNTHTRELSDDLPAAARLVDDRGNDIPALAWKGDGPGGHHRSGVLEFRAPAIMPAAIELSLARPGERAPRVFRWRLK